MVQRRGHKEQYPGLRIRLRAADHSGVPAETVGLFLFDFTVAFELFRGVAAADVRPNLSRWSLYRGYRRVRPEERLVVERLRMDSPLEIVAATVAITAASAAALWATVQSIERIYMMPINHKKVEVELRKLQLEAEQLELDNAAKRQQLSARIQYDDPVAAISDPTRPLDDDETERVMHIARRRLVQSPIQLSEMDIDFARDIEPPAV